VEPDHDRIELSQLAFDVVDPVGVDAAHPAHPEIVGSGDDLPRRRRCARVGERVFGERQ
jgi:hypothetical protein